jgi:cell cycle sensor histidine kinase DivJ
MAAEQATQAKDRFLATVSHELRTPLNAIIGFAEVLSGEAMGQVPEAKRQEYANIIYKSGNHLLEIVNALLDISKIESGKLDLQSEPFRFETLVAGCVEIVHMRAEQAGIRVRADIEPGLPEVYGDRRACRQVLVNLLSNAVKFTPAGGRVTVKLGRVGDSIECSVDDTGIGISRDDLPRLGDPFFQAADNLDHRFEGTGLGLSIVRGLIGLMGGSMTIESSPGQGTLVTVGIPVDVRLVDRRSRTAAIVTRPRGAKPVSPLQPPVRKRA